MKKTQSPYLNHFSWEEWDNQMIVVLYRSDRRYVVKRYVERVLSNSSQWQSLARSSFSTIDAIPRAYILTEEEAKLMHRIFAWHLNGTLTFPIISGLDQLIEWEDLLDFIWRAEQIPKDDTRQAMRTRNSPSVIPTIPIGVSSSKATKLKSTENNKSAENSASRKENSPPKTRNKIVSQQCCVNEHKQALCVSYKWVQINNVCAPCIVKDQQAFLLPYQVLLDCDLLSEQEQALLINFTTKANTNDMKVLESIIESSSVSIDFKLDNNLLLIDLYDLIFGLTKVVYIKLLNNQNDVNKKYKTVLAQSGGTAMIRSHSVSFVNIGQCHYVLLDSLLSILQPKTKTASILRQQSLPARSYEIDYLRLIELYQRKNISHDSHIATNQEQPLILNFDDIDKYIVESDIVIDMLLPQYQKLGNQKLRKQVDTNVVKATRKPTKRKASATKTDPLDAATEQQ